MRVRACVRACVAVTLGELLSQDWWKQGLRSDPQAQVPLGAGVGWGGGNGLGDISRIPSQSWPQNPDPKMSSCRLLEGSENRESPTSLFFCPSEAAGEASLGKGVGNPVPCLCLPRRKHRAPVASEATESRGAGTAALSILPWPG